MNCAVQIILANSLVDRWLRAHGRPKQPELSEKQKIELRECFDIIDSAGTGIVLKNSFCASLDGFFRLQLCCSGFYKKCVTLSSILVS